MEADGTIVLIDVGAVGHIGPGQRRAVLDMLAAAAAGEATLLRQALVPMTVLDRRVDVHELEPPRWRARCRDLIRPCD